jgi:hypothetical protein
MLIFFSKICHHALFYEPLLVFVTVAAISYVCRLVSLLTDSIDYNKFRDV